MAGGRDCGIHFVTDTPEALLPQLRRALEAQRGPDPEQAKLSALLERLITELPNEGGAPKTEAQKAQVREILAGSPPDGPESAPAVVVVRPDFVSLFWGERFRMENLSRQTARWAKALGPALGAGIYDDNNVAICVHDGRAGVQGLYWFDAGDIQPLDIPRACRLAGREALAFPLGRVLACKDGAAMAAAFSRELGLALGGDALALGAPAQVWDCARVFDRR